MTSSRPLPLPLLLVLPFAALPLLAGCHARPKQYTSNVRLARIVVVHTDEKGAPVSTDVDLEWKDCPGDQRQTMRSGKEFSACMQKHKVGDVVPVTTLWEWDEHGHYDWHVTELGGCKSPPVDDDDSSFEAIRDCEPSKQHDAVVGFHCDRLPEGELIKKCPWFRRE